MRLICPNCGAQYEVDDRVIPSAGRDVQCSACGHAWYQMPLGHSGADEGLGPDPDEILSPDVEDAEAEEAPATEAIDETIDETLEPEPEPEPEPEIEIEPEQEPEPQQPERREIDDGVRSILKEEAEQELAQRAAERVETQPDLGLETGPSPEEERRRIARERIARMRGLDEDEIGEDIAAAPAPPVSEPEKQVPRRDLFPDIEEINSTLDGDRAASEAGAGVSIEESRGGFGRGFFLMIFVAALLLAVYVLAPNFAETVPALEPALTGYVDAVNAARAWLDQTLRGLIETIETMAGEG